MLFQCGSFSSSVSVYSKSPASGSTMVLMHENHRLGTQLPTYMNALGCLLNLVGWQESQVSAHAKALAGTVNTASLN